MQFFNQINRIKINLKQRTIDDFGEQWRAYTFNEEYYGSVELLKDIFGKLVDPSELKGTRVMEIGSGTGRIVNMLLDAGASHVIAVEPAGCFSVLKDNTRHHQHNITYLNIAGDEIPANGDMDKIFAIGVIHHIPNPAPVLEAAFKALKQGGKIFIWVYGREGNGLYLSIFQPLRAITRRLPHKILDRISKLLERALSAYILLCQWIPLPMHSYMRNVLAKFDRKTRALTIYDQLNPAWAKYYYRKDAIQLLVDAGFVDVDFFHRHGYSWSLVATKPYSF